MDAVQQAHEMMKEPLSVWADPIKRYAEHLGAGSMNSEVLLTACAHYAQVFDNLPCDDPLYKVTPEGEVWLRDAVKEDQEKFRLDRNIRVRLMRTLGKKLKGYVGEDVIWHAAKAAAPEILDKTIYEEPEPLPKWKPVRKRLVHILLHHTGVDSAKPLCDQRFQKNTSAENSIHYKAVTFNPGIHDLADLLDNLESLETEGDEYFFCRDCACEIMPRVLGPHVLPLGPAFGGDPL